MNQTIETILTRRSTRKFLEKPIPEADLKLIVEAALCAPSGKNGQTWKFTVVESRQMIEKLSRAIEVTLGRTGYDMYRPQTIIIKRQRIWKRRQCLRIGKHFFSRSFPGNRLCLDQPAPKYLRRTSDPSGIRRISDSFRPCGIRSGRIRLQRWRT